MLANSALARASIVVSAVLVAACDGSSSPPASGDGAAPPPARWMAAVGAKGTFTQTFDAVTWTTRRLTPIDLYAVACVGNLDGWAAGADGSVAHTTDGGSTWTWQSTPISAALRTVRFSTSTSGVVAGDAGALATTTDGGSTWRLIAPLTNVTLRSSAVAASAGVMVVVGDAGVVLRSVDGGRDFSRSVIDGAGDLRGVASDSSAHLVLAVDTSGSVWSSSDAGASFVREASAGAPLEAVAMADDGTAAIAAGAHGAVLERSSDATWRTSATGTGVDLHAALIMSEPAATHYVAGEAGTLLSSSDRGATWSAVKTGTADALYALDDL